MSHEPDGIQSPVQKDLQNNPAGTLHDIYLAQQTLFEAQPPPMQRFLEMQARTLAEALIQGTSQVHFKLPDQVVLGDSGQVMSVPAQFHQQMVGGLITSVTGTDIRTVLRHHFT